MNTPLQTLFHGEKMLVYLVTNVINGKRYIGQTSLSLERRWFLHQHRKSCKALHSAILFYGAAQFTVEVLFSVPTREQAGELEIEYIERYNTKAPNGYNLTKGGEGVKALPEHIRLERNRKLLGNKNAVGVVRTPEYRKAISDRQQGREFTDAWRQRMSEAAKGRKASQDTKDKLSRIRKQIGIRPPKRTSEEAAEAGRISGHKRYHVSRNIVNRACKFCNIQ
jgi:group I intron endonuclease